MQEGIMNKKIKVILYFIVTILAINGFFNLPIFTDEVNKVSEIADRMKMPIPSDSAVIYYKNTHGGFLGDGMTYGVLKLSDKGNKEFRKTFFKKSVNKLPVTNNIKKLIKEYFSDDEDIEIGSEEYYISKTVVTFPEEIKKGYYYLIDRNAGDYPEGNISPLKM